MGNRVSISECKIDRIIADIALIKKALGLESPAPASVTQLQAIARNMLRPKKNLRKTK